MKSWITTAWLIVQMLTAIASVLFAVFALAQWTGFGYAFIYIWWLLVKKPYRRVIVYDFPQSNFSVEVTRW